MQESGQAKGAKEVADQQYSALDVARMSRIVGKISQALVSNYRRKTTKNRKTISKIRGTSS